MNKYLKLKKEHQNKVNDFPMFFAFSEERFKKGMEKFGLDSEKDTDKIYSIGAGGFIRRQDSKNFKELMDGMDEELWRGINEDPDGTNFIYDMFLYELGNHEYGYTGEIEDTLESLGITEDDIAKNDKLKKGLELAKKKIMDECLN